MDLGRSASGSWPDGEETGGGFSLVEHPIPPKTLVRAGALAMTREDEYSFVIEGRMGALLGDDVVYAEVGDFAFKPRRPVAHVLESRTTPPAGSSRSSRPGGFEHFFEEMADLVASPTSRREGLGATRGALRARVRPGERAAGSARSTGSTNPMLHMG